MISNRIMLLQVLTMKKFRQFNEAASQGGKREYKRSERRDSDGPKRRFGKPESKGFGRQSRPEGRSFDRRPRTGALELHRAVCERCGESCEVPFKPTGNKPVYCRDCFKKNDSSDEGKFAPRRSNDRFESKPTVSSDDIAKINRKLDKIMKALNIE